MEQKELDKLDEISKDMYMGNWSLAIEAYKKLNISPREFSEYVKEREPMAPYEDFMFDFALLGFYTRGE
jgi:hypothetical protein